ncbi:MAG: ATP-binding protein [Marinifilaceae bacterium]|nr:ATP-binding protein [Marinifilaceae bacterium]
MENADKIMMREEWLLDNKIQEIEKLPSFVEKIQQKLSLSPALALNLNLALEEALTNIIQYAYPDGREEKIQVVAKSDAMKLILILKDRGIAFDPTQLPDADTSLSVEDRPIGGLGFFLIRQMMDKVEYRRDGGLNVLTLTKFLREEPGDQR